MKRSLISLTTLGMVLAMSIIACTISISEQTAVDIYSVAIRQLYSVDHSYDETFEFPVLYLVATTDDNVGDKSIPEAAPTMLEESVRIGIEANLDDFAADLVWVEDYSDVSWEGGRVEGGGAIIQLGNINF